MATRVHHSQRRSKPLPQCVCVCVCAHTVLVFFLQPVRDSGAPGGPDYHRDHLHAAGMGGLVEAALCGEWQQHTSSWDKCKKNNLLLLWFLSASSSGVVDVKRVFLLPVYVEIQPKRITTAPLVSPQRVVLTVILHSLIASLYEQKWWTQSKACTVLSCAISRFVIRVIDRSLPAPS